MEFDIKNPQIKLWRESYTLYLVVYPTGDFSILYKTNVYMDFTWISWIIKTKVKIVEIDPEERICWVDYVI